MSPAYRLGNRKRKEDYEVKCARLFDFEVVKNMAEYCGLGLKKLQIKNRKGPYQVPYRKNKEAEGIAAQGVSDFRKFLW